MSTLTGEVQRVTYENEETGFRVVKVLQSPREGAIVVVGVFQAVGPGNQVRAIGNYIEDKKHGRQFKADSLVVVAPETLDGIERRPASRSTSRACSLPRGQRSRAGSAPFRPSRRPRVIRSRSSNGRASRASRARRCW